MMPLDPDYVELTQRLQKEKRTKELMEDMENLQWELAGTVARNEEALLSIVAQKRKSYQENRDKTAIHEILDVLQRWKASSEEFMIVSGKYQRPNQRPALKLIVNK